MKRSGKKTTLSLSLPNVEKSNILRGGIRQIPTEPKMICITVDHSNLLTTDKDRRANRYINELLSLKSHLPGSVPLEYLDFCVREVYMNLDNCRIFIHEVNQHEKYIRD
ncbi:hypothetical protein TNCV_4042341 [Trichonephila clavipes]|nr:hypothetical protein TNCV_4042341 [Trichonephila clavipes]